MTGRNAASGIHDHAAIAERRHSAKVASSTDCWHYVKSPKYIVGSLMAIWVERDTRCAFVISSGARNMPKNYVRAGLGVGLCAADAVGGHLLSADANGMMGAMADISAPRWSEQRERKYPPNDCSSGYVLDFDGAASNAPVDVPWHLVPGMECRPENVAREYVEPLCYSM
jgi:hypothetical protein